MPYTHIIWDFNGTILDDVQLGIDSLNTLLSRRGKKTLDSVAEYHKIFGFPIIKYYERAGFDFSKEPYEVVAVEWVKEYTDHFHTATIREGCPAAFKQIRELGLKQIILSASKLEMLTEQVEGLGIADNFDGIYGIDNIYAESKINIAHKWRSENPDAKALFVGDTTHDLEVANAIGADCVFLADGHQSREILAPHGCPILSSPLEIIDIIKKHG